MRRRGIEFLGSFPILEIKMINRDGVIENALASREVAMLRDKIKTAKLREVNSTVDKPSTLVGFFQQIFCMPFPSIGVEQDRFSEADIG